MTAKKGLAGALLAASGVGVLLLPGAKQLPVYRPTTVDGIKNMRHARRACQQTGLQGWDLVTYAQRVVSQKFSVYSTLNLWDPPNRAFIHGMGYCTQYNLALKHLLDHLGFETRAVFSLKVRVFDNDNWTMGHTWLRVTHNGETRDVCAGRAANKPGQVHFAPMSRVFPGHPFTLFLTHLGMILFCGVLGWTALLTKRPCPTWMYAPPSAAR